MAPPPALPYPTIPNDQAIPALLSSKKQLIFPDNLARSLTAPHPSGPLAAGQHVGCVHASIQCSQSTLAALEQLQRAQRTMSTPMVVSSTNNSDSDDKRLQIDCAETASKDKGDIIQDTGGAAGTSTEITELALIPAYFGKTSTPEPLLDSAGKDIGTALEKPIAVSSSVDSLPLQTGATAASVASLQRGNASGQSIAITPTRKEPSHTFKVTGRMHSGSATNLDQLGPLARSVSNLPMHLDLKGISNPVTSSRALSLKIAPAVAVSLDGSMNPFATTAAAVAAHKHAILEMEAAKLGLVLVKVPVRVRTLFTTGAGDLRGSEITPSKNVATRMSSQERTAVVPDSIAAPPNVVSVVSIPHKDEEKDIGENFPVDGGRDGLKESQTAKGLNAHVEAPVDVQSDEIIANLEEQKEEGQIIEEDAMVSATAQSEGTDLEGRVDGSRGFSKNELENSAEIHAILIKGEDGMGPSGSKLTIAQ